MRGFSVLLSLVVGLLVAQPAQAVTINVDLSSQTMQVTSAAGESYTWAISSGRAGFNTPRGYYKPTNLQRMHYSRKYDMSPMPHSIFFRGGYAIHGTAELGRLGRPASHGCIRLAPGNAAKLFAMVKREGARISISGSPLRTVSPGAFSHWISVPVSCAIPSAGITTSFAITVTL